MTPPPEIRPGVGWRWIERLDSWAVTIGGQLHLARQLTLSTAVQVTWNAEPDGEPGELCLCDDFAGASEYVRRRLRSLRDELNRLDPPEGPDWRKRADGEFPEGVHLRAVEVHIKGKFAYWDIEVGYFDEEGEFVTTCGDVSGWSADAGTYWAPVRLPEEP